MDTKIKQYLMDEYEHTKQKIDFSNYKQQLVVDAINDQLLDIFSFNEDQYLQAVQTTRKKWTFWFDQVDHANFLEILKYLLTNNFISSLQFNNWMQHSQEHTATVISEIKQVLFKYISEDVFKIYFNYFRGVRSHLADRILAKLELINKLTKNMSCLSSMFAYLWDLSPDKLYKLNYHALLRLEKTLAKNDFIHEIAKILGSFAEHFNNIEKVEINEEVFKPAKQATAYGTDNITSIKHGNDIPIVLKYQLALRYSENGNKLFKYLYLEKKLLELEQHAKLYETSNQKSFKERNTNQKGPFIICVDTSGSMSGKPELIAKAVCLAIVRIANEQNRGCFIYTFSIRTMGFEATKIAKDYTTFYKFLSTTFSGGTDLVPVLNDAIDKLQETAYKNADILLITDFQIGEMHETLLHKIDECKNKNTRFHGLMIGNTPTFIPDFLDNIWTYDGSKASAKKIIEDIRNPHKKKI